MNFAYEGLFFILVENLLLSLNISYYCLISLEDLHKNIIRFIVCWMKLFEIPWKFYFLVKTKKMSDVP